MPGGVGGGRLGFLAAPIPIMRFFICGKGGGRKRETPIANACACARGEPSGM